MDRLNRLAGREPGTGTVFYWGTLPEALLASRCGSGCAWGASVVGNTASSEKHASPWSDSGLGLHSWSAFCCSCACFSPVAHCCPSSFAPCSWTCSSCVSQCGFCSAPCRVQPHHAWLERCCLQLPASRLALHGALACLSAGALETIQMLIQ